MDLKFDLSAPSDKKLLGKLRRGQPVQVKPIHFPKDGMSGNVRIPMSEDKLKKAMKAMKMGRGMRISLAPEEAESMSGSGLIFTKTGRVSTGRIQPSPIVGGLVMTPSSDMAGGMAGGKVKSLKQLNRESKKAFESAGKKISKAFTKDLPRVSKAAAKGYRKHVRPYASPVFKTLIEEGLPMLGEIAVTEGLKAADVPAPVAKIAGKAAKAGLKKPSQMAYKKSGLGLKSDINKMFKKAESAGQKGMSKAKSMGKSAVEYVGEGASLPVPVVRGAGRMRRMYETDKGTYKSTVVEEPRTLLVGGRIFSDRLIDPEASAYQPNTMAESWTPVQLGRPVGSGLYAGRSGMGLYAGRGLY